MDTAFCRIYHVECRGWVEQKRFSFVMLGSSSLLPRRQRLRCRRWRASLVTSTDNLPFGLSDIKASTRSCCSSRRCWSTFLIFCVIFWAVPKGHMPWRGVWPGALFVTLTTGSRTGSSPSTSPTSRASRRFGSTLGFILIALVWFYALSLSMLAGAVINALRHELHDTGEMPYASRPFRREACGCESELSSAVALAGDRAQLRRGRGGPARVRTVPERERITSDSVVACRRRGSGRPAAGRRR